AIFKDGIIRHTAVILFGGNVITEDIKEGCSIIEKQAELLKIKFGSAWPGENKENEIVSIPGLRGREPKEISLKNLSKIIHARVVEIIEQVYLEIKNYGYDENKKKLIAGIVLTGGGSQLKHIKQLVEFVTGMDTRIGFPNEHLASESDDEFSSPAYATAVGLVLKGVSKNQTDEISVVDPNNSNHPQTFKQPSIPEPEPEAPKAEEKEEDINPDNTDKPEENEGPKNKKAGQQRKGFLENWADKFRNFLNDDL
ncbi:MAG TPA: cell division protein FtsA, partial [Cryomorphaceae bacterium]|nr:cell division protein FtsA [Cryomorphaceae bacterium]